MCSGLFNRLCVPCEDLKLAAVVNCVTITRLPVVELHEVNYEGTTFFTRIRLLGRIG
jgi:hypothetical protein